MFLLLQIVVSNHAPLVSNLEMWSALSALAVPFITATIVAEHWRSSAKVIAFAVVACLTAFVTTWLTGSLDRHDLLRSVLIVVTAAQLAFHSFRPAVTEVQNATSVGIAKAPAAAPNPPVAPPPA